MKKEVNFKNILIAVTLFFIAVYLFNLIVKPYKYIDYSLPDRFMNKVRQTQEIEPSRLFVNAWRLVRNEYVDATMNNQNWYRWRNKYLKEIKTIDDANVAINTMLASLNDPYTTFLQSGAYSKQKIIMESQITGVGITFQKTGDDIVINNVLKNSPAQENKILPGDKIVSINGIDVRNMTSEDIHSVMESNAKKSVKIQIQRGEEIISKKLKKKVIPIDTMEYRITKDNIGIIKLDNVMGGKALDDFKNIIEKTNGTKGIIIDLRNNYGGILANALQMADMMIADKKIVSIESKGVPKYQVYGDETSIFEPKPIVILVNKKTASAAEILTGALKDSMDAIVIGENTYGKNTIQQVIPMQNGTGLVVTTNKYILPSGEDIYKKGITPNVILTGNNNAMKTAIDIINSLN